MKFIKELKLKDNGKHLLIKGDIKEMYSNLDHNELIKIIDWFIRVYRKYTKENIITIKQNGKLETYSGVYGGNKGNLFKHLKIEEIKQIAIYDITNAYLRIGRFVLKQEKGNSDGFPLSHILAIMYCNRAENYFIETLNTQISINGIRYIDDLLLILSGKKLNHEIIDNIIRDLKCLYNSGNGIIL